MKSKFIKIILVTIIAVILVHPFNALAATISQNLEEVLIEEELEHPFSDYKENDDQITIYFFRGKGCGFSAQFLTYLGSLVNEYGKYFNVEAYEVWYNADNSNLLYEVADFLGKEVTGVPFVVIGDQVFDGYLPEYNDAIREQIMAVYNSEDRYDVMEEMKEAKKQEENSKISGTQVIFWNFLFVLASTMTILSYNMKKFKDLSKKIEKIEKKKK